MRLDPGSPQRTSQGKLGSSWSSPELRKGDVTVSTATPSPSALYSSPSFSSLQADAEDLEPGPGSYDQPSSIGLQFESTKESIPSTSLTAKHTKSWAKTWISKEHLCELLCRDTPGPGTYQPRMLDSQARVRFGNSKRKPLADTTERAPGPEYQVRTKPTDVRHQTKFSKGSRWEQNSDSLSSSLGSTGPGQYESSTVFDGVRLAKSFGCSHRAYDKVTFPGQEREMIGKTSPGPGTYKPWKPDGSEYSFSRATKLKVIQTSNLKGPGPGQYDSHLKHNPSSRNALVYSFGKPRTKARLDWKAMQNFKSSTWGVNANPQ